MPLSIPESPEFQRLVAGEDQVDLVRIALEIARDSDPELEFEPVLGQIEALADRVRPRIRKDATVEDRIRQVNWVLYVEEGISGNEIEYDDPRNSYLHEVLARKTGIPISLCVLYQAISGKIGLEMSGVNLPCHFVLRADREDGSTVFLDAFQGGAMLDQAGCQRLIESRAQAPVELTEAHFQPCSTADIVARMLRNLQVIHLRSGDLVSALPVARRLAALRPGEPGRRRDLGMILYGLDRLDQAVEQLSAYLEQAEQPRDAEAVRGMILKARRGLAGER